MHESSTDVLACVLLAISLFAASLVPWLLLVNAEHLTPAWMRELPAKASELRRDAALSAAALLLLLSAPKGSTS
jgi:Flp pilus assembly protein protease CpaA